MVFTKPKKFVVFCAIIPPALRRTTKCYINCEPARWPETGPSKPTRGPKVAAAQRGGYSSRRDQDKVTGRLKAFSLIQQSSSFTDIPSDANESVRANGRTDDGSDRSTFSSQLAKSAVLSDTGKMKETDPASVQVALKDGD